MRISDWSSDVCSSDLATNKVDGWEDNSAGGDKIFAGEGDNLVAGDAQAIADGVAKAFGDNEARDGAFNDAGNDTIFGALWGSDTLSGGAQAKAGTFALADQDNHAGSDDEGQDRKSTRLNSSH